MEPDIAKRNPLLRRSDLPRSRRNISGTGVHDSTSRSQQIPVLQERLRAFRQGAPVAGPSTAATILRGAPTAAARGAVRRFSSIYQFCTVLAETINLPVVFFRGLSFCQLF